MFLTGGGSPVSENCSSYTVAIRKHDDDKKKLMKDMTLEKSYYFLNSHEIMMVRQQVQDQTHANSMADYRLFANYLRLPKFYIACKIEKTQVKIKQLLSFLSYFCCIEYKLL